MTTQEVANRLVELFRTGQIIPAQEELFSDNVKSIEPNDNMGARETTGKAAVIEKGKNFSSLIEEVHNSYISDPIVAGDWFSISWLFEITLKGMGRQKLEEICVYQVKDGKILSEQFFS